MRRNIFARTFGIENKTQRTAVTSGTGVSIGAVNGQRLMRQQITRWGGTGNFVFGVHRLAKVGYALGKTERFRASMRAHNGRSKLLMEHRNSPKTGFHFSVRCSRASRGV